MKLFNTETKKMPARAQIARWIAQGVVLGVVLPGSAFAVAPLNGSGAEPTATLATPDADNCYLEDSSTATPGTAGIYGGALYGDEVWLNSTEKAFGIWSCSTSTPNAVLAAGTATIDRGNFSTAIGNSQSYVIYKTTASGNTGFLKFTTDANGGIVPDSCMPVDAPVANVCNPTATTSTPANIPVFGPIGLLASLTGLLWFGRRRRKD